MPDQDHCMQVVHLENTDERTRLWNFSLLTIAVAIDLVDLLPFNFPASALTTVFLIYLGVTPSTAIIGGLIDLIPVLDLFPWCTLAVLYKKFGVSWGIDRVFKEKA